MDQTNDHITWDEYCEKYNDVYKIDIDASSSFLFLLADVFCTIMYIPCLYPYHLASNIYSDIKNPVVMVIFVILCGIYALVLAIVLPIICVIDHYNRTLYRKYCYNNDISISYYCE